MRPLFPHGLCVTVERDVTGCGGAAALRWELRTHRKREPGIAGQRVPLDSITELSEKKKKGRVSRRLCHFRGEMSNHRHRLRPSSKPHNRKTSNPTPPVHPHFQTLEKWFKEHHVSYDHNAIHFTPIDGAFGVIALRDLKVGETVAQISKEAVLSARNCGVADILGEYYGPLCFAKYTIRVVVKACFLMGIY